MKTKKLPQFELSQYDFLDNVSLAVWVQEFARRNNEFHTEYTELNKLAEVENHKEYYVLLNRMIDKWGFMPVVPATAHAYTIYGLAGLPREPVRVHEKVSPNVWSNLCPDGTREDILRITINLLFTNKEILQTIDDILTKKRKSLKDNRKRSVKWKSYLMVYDIKQQYPELTFNDIANILPDLYDVRSIENHYAKADHLIKGGYKKYLPKFPSIP